MQKVDVYVFSSDSVSNIEQGHAEGQWAVPKPSEGMPLGKRARRLTPGSRGIFYCSDVIGDEQFLTIPFLVTEAPDIVGVGASIWPEYIYPFRFRALGPPSRRVYRSSIASLLAASIPAGKTWSNVLHIQGRTVFNPSRLVAADWEKLVAELGT